MAALAALVPWAEAGMRQIRAVVVAAAGVVGLDGQQAGSSPWEPALGCSDTAS